MISASYFSLSHGIATEVSSPPEYANTIRSITALLSCLVDSRLFDSRLSSGVLLEPLDQCRGAPGVAGNDENRIVAADRADGFGQLRPIDGDGERLRLADAGADDHELLDAFDPPQVFLGRALKRHEGRFRIGRIRALALIRAVAGALDQAEVLDVARDRRLRRVEAEMPQPTPELFLAVQQIPVDQLEDQGLAARFHRTGPALYIDFY